MLQLHAVVVTFLFSKKERSPLLIKKKHHSYLAVHDKLRPWKCDVCPQDFGTKGSLKLHVERVHMGLRPKVCEECGKSFKSATELKLHRTRAHTSEGLEKHHMCHECGASYTMLTTLNKHVRRVHRYVFVRPV